MSLLIILWSMLAGTALTLGIVHALVWLSDRKALANLAFAVVALALASMAPIELLMMHATGPGTYATLVRWFQVPIFLANVGLVLFVWLYLGTSRMWLGWLVIGLRTGVLVANFILPTSFNFTEIATLERVSFIGHEVATVGEAASGWWQWLATLSVVLLTVFTLDAAIALWRKGGYESRRRAVIVGGGIVLFVAIAILMTQLVIWGAWHAPLLVTPPFFITMLAMAVELSRDLVRAARLSRELQESEEETKELRRDLAHAGRVTMLGQLSSALAHELNQPLGAILRNAEAAEMMLRSPTPDLDELRAIIADIRQDDRRAGEVIDRLRALLGRRSVEFQPVGVDGLLNDVITLVRGDAAARRIALEFATERSLPPVLGDKVHLSQVLLNLIINGMDAVGESRESQRRVIIETRRTEDMVEIAVKDFGPGLAPEVTSRLFQPFVTTKPHGMGMGLAVSRTIIEAHGGRLWAASSAGQGAIFRFTVPLADEAPA
jgi:signal transduction histidine kinase